MDFKLLRQHLSQKYIEPTKKKRGEYIGVEIEMSIVNLSKKAVDFEVIHEITKRFISHFKFAVAGTDDEENIFSAQNAVNGDILSYDCSYNNLELSFGKEQNLYIIQKRFSEYYDFVQNELKLYNYTLTGMGINPYRNYNHNVPIPNGRYPYVAELPDYSIVIALISDIKNQMVFLFLTLLILSIPAVE